MDRRRFLTAAGVAGLAAMNSANAQDQGQSSGAPGTIERLRTPKKHPSLVLTASYKEGAFDSLAVDCPFLFRHEGRFYMTFIGFDGIGYRTGLAVSDDLVHWEKQGLIIDRGPVGSPTEFNVALTWIVRDNALWGPGTLKKVNGRYLGTYHCYPKPGYETGPAAIGLCWSDDILHWELLPPFLFASDPDAAAWESGGLYKSCLVEHEGAFYMFYNAKTADEPWVEQIGLVTSSGLEHWQRHPGNPLIPVGPRGAFDDRFCSDPCVVNAGDAWAMFFYTLSSDGRARDSVAFSTDLLSWHTSGEILIDVGPTGSIDSQYAHKPGVFAHNGVLYHYYCAVAPNPERQRGEVTVSEIRGIALATSEPA